MTLIPSKLHAILKEVDAEVSRATSKYPPFVSVFEGYSVLLEEVDELWDHVKVRQGTRDVPAMIEEAIQVAAMACRFAHDFGDVEFDEASCRIESEVYIASKVRPLNSAHEGYGILFKKLQGLWVRLGDYWLNSKRMAECCIDIAAAAVRFAHDLGGERGQR